MPDFIKCPECGELFNPAYLDQVAKHMHAGIEINETIKGVLVGGQECTGCEFENLEESVCKCKTCGKIIDLRKI